jgi:hypothetical protein
MVFDVELERGLLSCIEKGDLFGSFGGFGSKETVTKHDLSGGKSKIELYKTILLQKCRSILLKAFGSIGDYIERGGFWKKFKMLCAKNSTYKSIVKGVYDDVLNGASIDACREKTKKIVNDFGNALYFEFLEKVLPKKKEYLSFGKCSQSEEKINEKEIEDFGRKGIRIIIVQPRDGFKEEQFVESNKFDGFGENTKKKEERLDCLTKCLKEELASVLAKFSVEHDWIEQALVLEVYKGLVRSSCEFGRSISEFNKKVALNPQLPWDDILVQIKDFGKILELTLSDVLTK